MTSLSPAMVVIAFLPGHDAHWPLWLRRPAVYVSVSPATSTRQQNASTWLFNSNVEKKM